MKAFVLQSCSKRKHRLSEPCPAFELYDGHFFRIIKNAIGTDAESVEVSPFDIWILSAEHGLVAAGEPLEYYDRRLDSERADKLAQQVNQKLKQLVADGEYDCAIINAGQDYQALIDPSVFQSVPNTRFIDGRGMGEKGHYLKRALTLDDQYVTGGA
jgi:hypothetical protein